MICKSQMSFGAVPLDGEEIRVYTSGYGKLISQRRGSSTSFYHFDALGSTNQLTNSSELVTDSYLYSAFGGLVSSDGSTLNPFRWIGSLGYYFDSDVLDYYVRARFFDPLTGRWLSEDPVGYIEAATNLFEYVGGNPTKAIDPSGLMALWHDSTPTESRTSTPVGRAGKSEKFYVCIRRISGKGWKKAIARNCDCRHWDIYSDVRGMVYNGSVGPVQDKLPKRLPSKKTHRCFLVRPTERKNKQRTNKGVRSH